MLRVALHTLGCKVNQYETDKIADSFRSRGCEIVGFSDHAHVYVINSCTVTQVADSKSRQAVRSAVKRNSDAVVVLTGCYVETAPEQAHSIEGVSLVVGNQEKGRLVDKVTALLAEDTRSLPIADLKERSMFGNGAGQRTRALVKIQDGCNQFCSYCAVPFARPNMSVKPCSEVVDEVALLASRGFKEVVLTGIRLGLYEDGGTNLVDLVEILSAEPGIERIRLSSIELSDISPGLVDLMARNSKICRHLHVPLQSGDNGVLERMNRPYTSEQFASFVHAARETIPGIAVTTDVMVGFPDETEAEFQSSYSFVELMGFARLHVFRYSSRPGTVAASMEDSVPAAEKERRSTRFIELGDKNLRDFASPLIGRTVPVLVESKKLRGSARSGITDNYVRVVIKGTSAEDVGRMLDVRVDSEIDGVAYGVRV